MPLVSTAGQFNPLNLCENASACRPYSPAVVQFRLKPNDSNQFAWRNVRNECCIYKLGSLYALIALSILPAVMTFTKKNSTHAATQDTKVLRFSHENVKMKTSDRNDEEFVSLNQKHMNGHFHFFAARILTEINVIFVSHPLPPRLTPNGIDLDDAPRPCESAKFIRWPIGHWLCRSICRAHGEFQRISMEFRLQHLQMPMNGIASNNGTINKNKEKVLKIAGRLMKTHTTTATTTKFGRKSSFTCLL